MSSNSVIKVGSVTTYNNTATWISQDACSIFYRDNWSVSPPFNIDGVSWQLVIIPKGYVDGDTELVSVFMRLKSDVEYKTNYSISVMGKDNTPCYHRVCGIRNYVRKLKNEEPNNKYHSWGLADFIQRQEILEKSDHYMSRNRLVILIEFYPDRFNVYNRFPYTFDSILNNTEECDVTLIVKVENKFKYLHAHINVLSKTSKVFAELFAKRSDLGKAQKAVVVEGFKHEVIVEMLRFLYTGEVQNMENMAQEILLAARRYGILDLIDVCDDFLYQNLSGDNASAYLDLANNHKLVSLKQNAEDLISLTDEKDKETHPTTTDHVYTFLTSDFDG
ncbi:protein roadkill-like [Phymastichus coffea]|uniref:protein roadkill-like n=1 Tax=Phymastichus coffea TaxID=108790 RepID=UPI00273B2339|nr:protein roadkill-like [Phymastichus coffea]